VKNHPEYIPVGEGREMTAKNLLFALAVVVLMVSMPNILHSEEAKVGDSQPAVVGDSQAAVVGHDQPAVVGHDQPAVVGHDQPAVVGHSEEPTEVGNNPPMGETKGK
jgi:hypothetical protein